MSVSPSPTSTLYLHSTDGATYSHLLLGTLAYGLDSRPTEAIHLLFLPLLFETTIANHSILPISCPAYNTAWTECGFCFCIAA